MELQVYTPGYGNIKDISGGFDPGFANAKYYTTDPTGANKMIDPDRYTIYVKLIRLKTDRSGAWGYKVIDNYGETHYITVDSRDTRQDRFDIYVDNRSFVVPKHTRPLPDYLIDLAKGDYLAYHEKLISAIMNNRGDASTVTNIGNEPTRFGGKRRRTIKRKSN